MQFKLDENLPQEARNVLTAAGHDAVTVLDQRLGGKPDNVVASVCNDEDRILITLDTDFSNIIRYPPAIHPGIIVIRVEDQSKFNVLSLFDAILASLKKESPARKLWIVEPHRIRVRGTEE